MQNQKQPEKESVFTKINYIFSAKEKVIIVIMLVAIIIGSFMELAGVAVFQPFMNVLMDQSKIHESRYLQWAYEKFGFSNDLKFITFLAGSIILVYVIKNVYLMLEKNYFYKFSYNSQMRISDKLLHAYLKEPYSFHLNRNIAELQRTLEHDTDTFTKGVIHVLELISELVTCLCIGIYLFKVSQSIAVGVIVLLIIFVLIFTKISKNFAKGLGVQCQIYSAKLIQWINQSLGGIKEIKILGRERYFEKQYHTNFAKYVRGLRISRLIAIQPKYLVETVCMTGLLSAIIVKINFGQKELIDYVPQLAVFAVAAMRLLPSVGRINEHYVDAMYSAPSLDLIYHDLKDIESYQDEESEKIDPDWKLQREINISHVNYAYEGSDSDVIHDASFAIRKGTSVAFIGASGAGKTTMADLILGLLSPQMGHIYADDMDIHHHLRTWHKEIGYIPQTIYLSDDSVRNNVAFGIDEDKIDEEKVISALKKAQLYDFVMNMPDGLDTYVGDRGVRISGGQRQRIGIARALYHDPEVLVLDEATSALDSETETAVMESIDSLHGQKTILIIAHRLTTIRNVDQIFEVENGGVIPVSKDVVFGLEDNPSAQEEQQ